jgi:hypothetical protein
MHIQLHRATAKPDPMNFSASAERPSTAPRSPELPGLTRDELRQIVLDLLG